MDREQEDRRAREAAGVELKEGKFFRGTTGSGGGVCRVEPPGGGGWDW